MKRAIAFIILLALGVLALKLAIGDETAVKANGKHEQKADDRAGNDKQPAKNTDENVEPQGNQPGVRIDSGNGVGASISQSGPLTIPRRRPIDLGEGRVRMETVYILDAKNSVPLGEGLQQLLGVTLKLFDKGKHAATVLASEAFIELGRDANGNPGFDESKEIDLRDAIITAEPGSRTAGLRLELGDARVTISEHEVQLTTEPEQFVKVMIEGKQSATLTGNGAIARLPRSKDSALRKADITILSNPKLETGDLSIQAAGRLHYVEDTVTGAAQITINDQVELDLEHSKVSLLGMGITSLDAESADPKARQTSTVRGDQFTGWLLRSKDKVEDRAGQERDGKKRNAMVWQRLTLVGAPATVDAPGVHVSTPRITVRPGPLGDPYVVTAHGGNSRIEQTELRPGSKQEAPVVGISPRRIHFVRPSESIGALHRSYGFPQWTLRSLEQQQIVIFRGASRIDSGTRTVTASDGLMVVRRASGKTGAVQGFGQIEVHQRGVAKRDGNRVSGKVPPDTIVKGNDGVLLIAGNGEERMRLGPVVDEQSTRWREHRYSVQHGDAKVKGLGGCKVTRAGERTSLDLRAPFNEIEAQFDKDGTALRNVRQLRTTFVGQEIVNLDVGGLPAKATLQKSGEQLLVQAPRMRSIGPRSLRLLPMELNESPWSEIPERDRTPRLMRTWSEAAGGQPNADYTVEVVGPRIDVHHVGGSHAIIDANADGDELPRVYAKLPQPKKSKSKAGKPATATPAEPATISCSARRLRILPFVLTPEVRSRFLGGARGLIPDLIFHSLARPWLLVDQVHEFELDDEQQGHIEGTGERLFLSQGGKSVLFVGNPDNQTPAIVSRRHAGRTVVMQGARVRVRNDDAVRLSALGSFDDRSMFLAPTMTLHEPGSSGLLAHMRAVCRGNIRVDPDAVRFGGPVEAYGLLPDGASDPDALHIDARQLILNRSARTGEIETVLGDDVTIDWTQLDAHAAKIELDLPKSRCIATDPKGAEIEFPNGRVYRSVRLSANYRTWSISTGPGRAVQRNTPSKSTPSGKATSGGVGQEGSK